ncbi:MAG: glycosyltransferase [Desulfobacterales bacterium]|jgi:glycosyltransferase involved in cell wall biosynthesis
MYKIDVIISAYNWEDALRKTLLGFTQQTYPYFRILIADDGSDSDTREVIKAFKKKYMIEIIHCWQRDRGFRKARMINKTMKLSKTRQVIFTDQDTIPHPDFVKEHYKRFVPNGILVGGYIRLSKEYTQNLDFKKIKNKDYLSQVTWKRKKVLLWKHVKSLFYQLNPLHSRRPSIMGLNFSIDRQAFLKVNGYDMNYEGWGQEDSDLANRIWKARFPFKSCWNLCLAFHQWHPENPTKKESKNREYYKRPEVPIRCKNGYLQAGYPTVLS